ncbi:unnamed protein product [Adineta ricciae]|uniref:Uncharacterized protein n=1 Tax=Adineta ricciae TaxID=249248 RepID=A0A815MSJ7_ADIRI|nr:unnamed protein product [Adineta ricciae]CAF1425442.1 unnamed protein product [Adineta ricciae]
MALLPISIRGFVLFLTLVQSVSLYRIYALNDNRANSLRQPVSSTIDDELNQELLQKYLGHDNEDVNLNENTYDNSAQLPLWALPSSNLGEEPVWASSNSLRVRSVKPLPQRRNNRPHWNPLVAAYKRCGELFTREERETCFKDAIQMLFVHKLRK